MVDKINIINNLSQTEKFGRRSNGLCFINVLTDGKDINKQRLSSDKLKDITNLFNLQFKRKLSNFQNFTFEQALNLIEEQENCSNKLIAVPLGINQKKFKELEDKFISLYVFILCFNFFIFKV